MQSRPIYGDIGVGRTWQGRPCSQSPQYPLSSDSGLLATVSPRWSGPRRCTCSQRQQCPLSSEFVTIKTVKARFWPWLESFLRQKSLKEGGDELGRVGRVDALVAKVRQELAEHGMVLPARRHLPPRRKLTIFNHGYTMSTYG